MELYCMTYPERHTITCGNCHGQHASTEGVRKCHEGVEVGSCPDLTRTGEYSEDGEQYIFECLADSWGTDRGWTCTRGHDHVSEEVRRAEGWQYAADADEAYLLRLHGVEAVSMRGDSI